MLSYLVEIIILGEEEHHIQCFEIVLSYLVEIITLGEEEMEGGVWGGGGGGVRREGGEREE